MLKPLPSHRPDNYACPFCHITQNLPSPISLSQPSDIVVQDDTVSAIIASHQYRGNAPNILVIPNAHYENIFDMPAALGGNIHRVAQQISFALKHVYDCDGISIRQHNEHAGSQHVWHYHLHITPRFTNDHFYRRIYDAAEMPAAERAQHAARLKAYFNT